MAKYTYITKECLFCNETDAANHPVIYNKSFKDEELDAAAFEARKVTQHKHYEMVKCLKTGLIFSRHILDDASLNELYKGSEIHFNDMLEYIKNDYWKPIAGHVNKWNKGKALDVGCSTGFFLEALKDNGYAEVYGCEPGAPPKAQARADIRENIHTGFYVPGLYPKNHFDLVTCFQTLDHLSDPLSMLKLMYDNVKPGGHAYLIMHNSRALQARIFGEKSPIIDVEHIYLFNKENLPMICEKAGFKVVEVVDIVTAYPFSYWLRMAPLPLKGMWIGLFKMLGLYKKILPFKAGNMGIILQK